MRSIAFADFLIGLGILFVLEGLMFAASPNWMRKAMKSAIATPDNVLRAVGIGSAVAGLVLIWVNPAPNLGHQANAKVKAPDRFSSYCRGLEAR
ncbi:uncharacterized protein YjeT (DUF2065 family) [Bradyrhizobium liaoningense]